MSIVLIGSTSGSVTLQEPAVAGTTVIDLPATSGTMAVTGGSPSFATLTVTGDATINGATVGKGAGNISNNTVVGFALYNNTTGSLNSAFGTYALASNTTGATNNAFGYSALGSTTTSSNNAAFGAYALTSNTTGATNTAVGVQSLNSNTTASNNTAVGYQAGYSITTGAQNTLVGKEAGRGITTGSYNAFFGVGDSSNQGAGYLVTTGAYNTIIGGFSGNQGGLDIRTANNRIVLSDGQGNPRQYINNNGQVAWGTTSIDGYLTLTWAGQTYVGFVMNNTDAVGTSANIRFKNNGTLVGEISSSTTVTNYVTSSDYRLKENVVPMTGALTKIAQLKPCTYTWKSTGEASQGFIAHELQAVVPDCVTGEKDALNEDGSIKPQGVDTSFLVATLTSAIQEQQAIITDLKARIETLENK